MYAAGLAKSTTKKEEEQQQLCQDHRIPNPHQIPMHSQATSTTTSQCLEAPPLQHAEEEDPLLFPLQDSSLEHSESLYYCSNISSNSGDGYNNINSGQGTTTERGRVSVGGKVRGEGFGKIAPWDGDGDEDTFLDQEGGRDEDTLLVEWSTGLDFDRQEYAALRKIKTTVRAVK